MLRGLFQTPAPGAGLLSSSPRSFHRIAASWALPLMLFSALTGASYRFLR